jgi:hypothetical protein
MLKRLGALGTMDAAEIKALRALLASEAAAQAEARRAPGVLGRLFARPAPNAEVSRPPPSPGADDALAFAAEPDLDAPLDFDLAVPSPDLAPKAQLPPATEAAIEGIAAALHIGALAPRRAAFGQRRAMRREVVLDLLEPAAVQLTPLLLTSPDDAPAGEIILHPGERAEPAARRAPPEPLHAETPFFPEDLEDQPGAVARALRPLASPPFTPPHAVQPAKTPAPKAGPEMAATFLLAKLAARLAHEEAALSARIAALG